MRTYMYSITMVGITVNHLFRKQSIINLLRAQKKPRVHSVEVQWIDVVKSIIYHGAIMWEQSQVVAVREIYALAQCVAELLYKGYQVATMFYKMVLKFLLFIDYNSQSLPKNNT